MAYLISPNLEKKYEKKIFLKLKLKYWRIFSKFRKILRILKKPFYKKIYSNNISFDTEILNKKKFLENSILYKQKSFCFVENILAESFYSNLLKNFPPKEFFQPARHINKQYNFGFKWVYDENETDLKTDYFYEVNHFFQVLKSTYFLDLLKSFTNDQDKRKLYSFTLT